MRRRRSNHQTTILVKFPISKNVIETNTLLLASILILIRETYHKNKSENVTISPLLIMSRPNSRLFHSKPGPSAIHAKSIPCLFKSTPCTIPSKSNPHQVNSAPWSFMIFKAQLKVSNFQAFSKKLADRLKFFPALLVTHG